MVKTRSATKISRVAEAQSNINLESAATPSQGVSLIARALALRSAFQNSSDPLTSDSRPIEHTRASSREGDGTPAPSDTEGLEWDPHGVPTPGPQAAQSLENIMADRDETEEAVSAPPAGNPPP